MSLDSFLSAIHAGGTCTFGSLKLYAKFRFPKSDPDDVYEKLRGTSYSDIVDPVENT